MITDRDIEKLKQVFATRDDLMDIKSDLTGIRNDLASMEGRIEVSIGKAVTQLIEYTNEVTEGLREDMNQGFAEVRGDITAMREDINDIKSIVMDQEIRVKRVERRKSN